MSYKQLIEEQRYQIQAYLSQYLNYREIGRKPNVSHSSINRELKRHTPSMALMSQVLHSGESNIDDTARRKVRSHRIHTNYVEFGLSFKSSPEQISGVSYLVDYLSAINGFMAVFKETGITAVSSIRTYDITAGDTEGETVPSESLFLIELISKKRPEIVDTKQCFGDWEV